MPRRPIERPMRPVPRGLFAPGGDVREAAAQSTRPIVPLEWLLSHPATVPWISKTIRTGLGAAFVTDTALQLDPSFEAVIVNMVIHNRAQTQDANLGIGFILLVNRVPAMQSFRRANAITDQSFDFLDETDGLGNSWGSVRVWVQEGSLVEVSMNNNGGAADFMGWTLRGYYWPVSLREEWLARGWRK